MQETIFVKQNIPSCVEFQALSFDKKRRYFNPRDNGGETVKIHRDRFFMGHLLDYCVLLATEIVYIHGFDVSIRSLFLTKEQVFMTFIFFRYSKKSMNVVAGESQITMNIIRKDILMDF